MSYNEEHENRINELESKVARLESIIENLVESMTSNSEAIIEHIASLETERDSILASYDDKLNEIVNKYEPKQ
ncbi:hypothetical protein PVA8_77 [Vibrio phage PVA8]|nr:hypothetical protein [Vibrio phage PC-Liy1]URQ03063.1 hypothetical protein PVA8_77 [Vibrio phage PVA8]WBM58799.1 hypothetical protein vBValMPVA8_77 [Vibrio phage vB_ValM_PVA8]